MFYYRKRDGRPLGVSTQGYRLTSLAVFFRWLTKNDYLLYNPAADLERPRPDRRLPRAVLSVEEVESVLLRPDVGDAVGLRDRAVMETLYSTGIRRREACGLQLHDVDHARGTLMVRLGKGRKDRVVPIGDRALAWVQKYADESRPRLVVEPDEGWLFLTAQGRQLDDKVLGAHVKQYLVAAGIEKPGSCHLFRHTCATLMLEGGADIRFIQAMLGHANLTSTQVYTNVAITKLKEVHTACHPGARMGRSRR
jgi:integrase/recombinase XerD